MTQHASISRNNTSVEQLGEYRVVTLHGTPIVKVHYRGAVTLTSGGWKTSTTKTRMNQVSNEWNLGFNVYQQDYQWYISIGGVSRGFIDGCTFETGADPAWLIGDLRFAW